MEENKPSKSITLMIADFRNALANTVNQSGLPASVTLLIVKDIIAVLENIAEQQYNADLSVYNDAISQENNNVRSN